MRKPLKRAVTLLAAAICAATCFGRAPSTTAQGGNALSSWRPTQTSTSIRYVGDSVCARCHTEETSTYRGTPMAHAAESPAECDILAANPRLAFREGPFSYQIVRQGDRSVYSVSDGTNTISATILYCFGKGVSGQTYLFRHDGALYESRVSYFRGLQGLGITILHPREVPKSLAEAVGRRMTEGDAQGCFACHSTPAAGEDRLRLDRLVPGVGCEACHGPGEKHVASMTAKNFKDPQILDPGKLDSIDQTQEFCGSCHMSFDKVMEMPDQAGINSIRFQPYRLFKSGPHLLDDARIGCVACHDPHDKTQHAPAFYDAKCLACHVTKPGDAKTAERFASGCPKSTNQCVTCHMPKVELPEMHAKFTDHWIR
jgi:hypothetical protein